MCLYGVGGAKHPDELLASLSSRQWAGWQIYARTFPLPHVRADINTALARLDVIASHSKHPPKLDKLIPRYGQPKRRVKSADLRDRCRAWAESANAAAAAVANKKRPRKA